MALEDGGVRRNRSGSWWKQRTKMERRLICALFVALLLVIGLVVGTAVAASTGKATTCQTKTCVKEAALLIKRMNASVNPCDDFYEFACGGYIAETELPQDKTELDPLDVIGDLISKQVKKVVTEHSKPGELRPFTLLKKFYAACVNTTAIEENSLDQMKEIFKSLGGWPILEQNNWVESDWVELTRKLRQHGFGTGHFITIDVDINPKNSSEYAISVDQATNEEVAEDNLKGGLKDRLVKTYAELLIDLAVLAGADREFATKEVHDVIEFRSKLAEIAADRTEHIKLIIASSELTVDELQARYSTVPWLDVMNGGVAVPNRTITGKDKVVLAAPKFVTEFEKIISNTPKRVQANHALLQVLRTSVLFMPKSFRDREQKFRTYAFGTTKALPVWETCIAKTTDFFHLAADALYVRMYVDEQARTDVTEMVTHIKDSFIKILNDVDWMDSNTKQQAINKAKHITPHVAYAVELRNDTLLEDYYAQLEFDSEHLLVLINEASKFKRDKSVSFFGKPVIRSHWTTRLAAITGNAVYDPQSNTIQIPSGIMQNEFYNKDRPQYMNYGGLGMVIGHEITHGFDNTGKSFDKDGNAVDWWEQATLASYESKAQCFIDQYGNYTVPEVKVNLDGERTLGENIADNGGMKEAYLAYLEWVKENKEELPLPALTYTSKQLFWISVANAWCIKIRPAALEQSVLADEHSPHRYRILGGLKNTRYFSEDFNCPIGSKMNPGKQCQVW